MNKVKNVAVVVPGYMNKDDRIAVEITKAKTKVAADLKGNKPTFKIDVTVEANVAEVKSEKADLTKVATIESLNGRVAAAIKNDIESAIKRAKTFKTDPFGFGQVFNRAYPKVFPTICKEWEEYIMPTIDVEVNVKASIERTGLLFKPVDAM
jgi:spore germination protein KC